MTTLGMNVPVKKARIDVDEDENFWFYSDDPASDHWTVQMTCKITRTSKIEPATKNWAGLSDQTRRNAWQLTPFSEYGYIDVLVIPADGEPFLAMKGHWA